MTKWFLPFVVVFAFNSCKNVATEPAAGTATIKGRVYLMQNGWTLMPPYSGAAVTIEGTTFSAITDDSGYYTLQGVPTGTYNVRFSKPGYGDVRMMSENVSGGGNADIYWPEPGQRAPILYKISNVITTLSGVDFENVSIMGEKCLVARGPVTPDSLRPQNEDAMAVFFSRTSDVSGRPGHYTTFLVYSECYNYYVGLFDTTSETFSFDIPLSVLLGLRFKSGDSIYLTAYGVAAHYSTQPYDYYDPTIGQYVLTSINQTPSPVIGAKVP